MQTFAQVHPVITQIKETGHNNYLVFETLPLGVLSFSFTYPAIIESNAAQHTVFMQATVFKLIHIDMLFTLKPDNDFTIVSEEIRFRSALPVQIILERVFRKQHEKLFENIELFYS
ncbi:hypothetical protein [Spirosoma montaniterrae]|uniref:Uncharacterized protein n=1 Tax=Spirosoma montaniterrae TaxID=1178516 RepID=A0A1P9WX40_9BACT|nr:hypothetical protein [Spirosoma montaniterrae]AQG79955.1 hypothetical protein AWR27_11835 [Spirosoma montaniterrae]